MQRLDLQPNVTTDRVHAETASLISDFIVSVLSSASNSSLAALTAQTRLATSLNITRAFLDPMILALRQVPWSFHLIKSIKESGKHLFRAWNSELLPAHCPYYPAWPLENPKFPRVPGETNDCVCGTPWASFAATIMSGLDQRLYPVVNADAIHDVRGLLLDLPLFFKCCRYQALSSPTSLDRLL